MTLSQGSVVGQGNVTGTVTLSAAAPAGGAVIALESSNVDVARVPASVTVAAGSTSASFTITTATVLANNAATIRAAYAGIETTVRLTVTPPLPRAVFSVSSPTRGSNACELIENGIEFDCTFDGSQSEGRLTLWQWTYSVASNNLNESRPEGQLVHPEVRSCSFFDGASTGTDSSGNRYIEMQVRLRVSDGEGRSNEASPRAVRVYPNFNCGQTF